MAIHVLLRQHVLLVSVTTCTRVIGVISYELGSLLLTEGSILGKV